MLTLVVTTYLSTLTAKLVKLLTELATCQNQH